MSLYVLDFALDFAIEGVYAALESPRWWRALVVDVMSRHFRYARFLISIPVSAQAFRRDLRPAEDHPNHWLRLEEDRHMATFDWSHCPAVESIPGKRSGAWVFRDTRTPVSVVFDNLEAGASIEEIMD